MQEEHFWAVYNIFQDCAHRAVLWYNMFIYDECINILAFILERFYSNICQYFYRKALKMWAGYSSDCHCCVFAPLCLSSFSMYSPTRLSSLTQQVVFHEGHKDLPKVLRPGFLSWQATMRNGGLGIRRGQVTDCWGRCFFCATAVAPSTPRWVQHIDCSWVWSILLSQGFASQALPLCATTENITHQQGQRREEQERLEERREQEKLQKLMGLNWGKMENCSCWYFLLTQEDVALATSKPAVHIKARLWHWAMMGQVQSLLNLLPAEKGPELGRLSGLRGEVVEVVLCCFDMISWMKSWFIHSNIPLEFCSHGT